MHCSARALAVNNPLSPAKIYFFILNQSKRRDETASPSLNVFRLITSNGNLLSNNRMTSLLKIRDLLLENRPPILPEEYIQVKVLYASRIQSFQRRRAPTSPSPPGRNRNQSGKVCNFVLSDNTGTIQAILYFSSDEDSNFNSQNIWRMLKKKGVFKITGFKLMDYEYNPRAPGLEANASIVRNNPIRIKLSNSTRDILLVPDPFYKHIPFAFVRLEDIDGYPVGSEIDVIGYVERVTEVKVSSRDIRYQWVFLKTNADPDGFTRKITLFDDNINTVCVSEAGAIRVYAFSQVKVQSYDNNVSLVASFRTIVMEVAERDFYEIIPYEFRSATFVTDLFPSRNRRYSQPQDLPLMPSSTSTQRERARSRSPIRISAVPRPPSPTDSVSTVPIAEDRMEEVDEFYLLLSSAVE